MTDSKKNTSILILLFLGVLMGALDISIVGPAIPSIGQSMHLDQRDLSWIFTIYVLFNLVGISLMARLSDIFGRRLIYVISIAIFGIGSLLVASSHDITLLLIGRGIQGFGASGIFPVASATIGDIYPVEKRGRALGLIGAVFGIAFLMGPFIAGLILMYFHWNELFLINIPIAIVILIFAWRLLPSARKEEKITIDWEGMIMLAVILTSLTLGLNNLDTSRFQDSIGSWSVLPFFLIVAILTPILIMMEATQKSPILNVALFRSRQVRLVGFIALGLGIFQSSIVFLPQLAINLFGVDPSSASFMLVPVVFATALASPLSGRLVDKLGSKIIIISGLLIVTASLFLMGMLRPDPVIFYIAEALLGFGLAIRASLNYIMLNEVPALERASTQGVLIIFVSVGQLIGATLTGSVVATSAGGVKGFGMAFLIMTILSVILFLVSFFLKNRKAELKINLE
jgi:EmrB/QacA subfamily drug resistance transporter